MTRLIGREQTIETVLELFETGVRLVTLTGPGGIGKTRVAIEVAHHLGRGGSQVAFTSLELVTRPVDVLSAIQRTLGAGDRPGVTALDATRAAVGRGPLLLVLDDLDRAIAARTHLVELLTSNPDLSLLVTCRTLLGIAGEHRVIVPPLDAASLGGSPGDRASSLTPAQELFVERATAIEPDIEYGPTDLAIVGRICRRLEGWPLAIELAATRVTHLSLQEIEQRLVDRFGVLSSPYGIGTHRHRALRDTVQWSYDLLTAEQRRVLRFMTPFRGGCSVEAAIQVAGRPGAIEPTGLSNGRSLKECLETDAAGVIDALRALAGASLLAVETDREGGTRYRLLDTIRDFAMEELGRHEEVTAARDRHANWYLALTEQAEVFPFALRALDRMNRLGPEAENEQAAFDWLVEIDDMLRLARLTAALSYIWWLRGSWNVARTRLTTVWNDMALPGSLPSSSRVTVGVSLGLILAAQGEDPELSLPVLEICVVESRVANDPVSLIRSLIALGWASAECGHLAKGRARLKEALEVVRTLPDDAASLSLAGVVLNNLGAVHRWDGEIEIAARQLDEAQMALERAGNVSALRYNLIDRAHVERDAGEDWAAWQLFQEAIQYQEMWKDHRYLIACLEGMATVAAAVGAFSIAARLIGSLDRASQLSGIRALNMHDGAVRDAAVRTGQRQLGDEQWAWELAKGYDLTLEEIALIDLPHPDPALPADRGLNVTRKAAQRNVQPDSARSRQTAALTRRERDVLQLLVSGYSNRQIADELFVSPRTVESHLSRIFGKLGVTGRTAAIGAAIRTGIVPQVKPAVAATTNGASE